MTWWTVFFLFFMKEMSVGITFTRNCAWKLDWKLQWLPLARDIEGRRPCGRMCCVCVCIDVWGDAGEGEPSGCCLHLTITKLRDMLPLRLQLYSHTLIDETKAQKKDFSNSLPMDVYSERLTSHLKGNSSLWPPRLIQGQITLVNSRWWSTWRVHVISMPNVTLIRVSNVGTVRAPKHPMQWRQQLHKQDSHGAAVGL